MIDTDRLVLRRWRDADLPAFRAQDADPRVRRFMGPLLTPEQSDAVRERHRGYERSHGLGFFTVERRTDGAVIGFCGLKPGAPGTPIEGEVEIGWLFGADYWGQGYAVEAARAALGWGWATLAVPSIAAITTAANTASRRVMDRLGMVHVPADDFIHPLLAGDAALSAHVTYRVSRPA
ncbi:GNAT family N-acetyltransferase [Sphingomonas sanxanigenens]|uniref:N-acetyltransferase domain-containing protein n=1 Tax=Sphingomonas sanxanigenens DSM 19645 = NX02 TaxID=1123269 RepID=W0AD19_9SPHN|nr:GNAT family N-acetyltransferase [Sphingomonas sanxanigenens]AHE54193.1 hypothetical protein NX02_12475 [Sphingomonas sanxanigenens DSM 19645 = NX02]